MTADGCRVADTFMLGRPPKIYAPAPVCRIHPRLIGPAVDLLLLKLCDVRSRFAPDWPTQYLFLDRARWAYLIGAGQTCAQDWLAGHSEDLVATYAARQSNGLHAEPITWRRLRDDIQTAMNEKFRPEALLND